MITSAGTNFLEPADVDGVIQQVQAAVGRENGTRQIEIALSRFPLLAPALVAFANSVELSHGGDGHDLSACRVALSTAARLEETSGNATHEYLRFLFAVENDSAGALPLAVAAIQRKRLEAAMLVGLQIEILRDLNRSQAADDLLRRAVEASTSPEELRAFGTVEEK